MTVPITISMKRRRSCAVLVAWVDSTDTTGTKAGIASAGNANSPSLAALIQFDSCCGARSSRHVCDHRSRCNRFGNNPSLLLIAPSPAADHARYFRVAPNDLRVVTNVIRDRDRIYGTAVTRRLRAMGIRDKPTAPASPWQNGFAERLIGSIRRECVDHMVVLGQEHLRRILRTYARYYNDIRTHRSLNQDAPAYRHCSPDREY